MIAFDRMDTAVVVAGYATGGIGFIHAVNGTELGSVGGTSAVRAIVRGGQVRAPGNPILASLPTMRFDWMAFGFAMSKREDSTLCTVLKTIKYEFSGLFYWRFI